MLSRYIRLFNTVKFLKAKQIFYRLYYFIRVKFRKVISFKFTLNKKSKSVELSLQKSICITNCYLEDNNLESAFKYATQVAMLHEGKIIYKGSSASIWECDNPYIYQFIRGLGEGPIKTK